MSPEEKKPEVRLYIPGKDDALCATLFNLVFEEKITPAFWHHKYAQNPDGAWAFLTFVEDKLISVSGWPVRRLKVDSETYPVVSMSDVMVHPKWRGRYGGRLGSIARPLWENIFKKASIPFGVAFPNPRHYLVGKRFVRAEDLGEFKVAEETFTRGWKTSFIAEIFRRLKCLKMKLPKNVRIERFSFSEPPFEDLTKLWQKVYPFLKVTYVKDIQHLLWRYFEWERFLPEKRRVFFLIRDEKTPLAFISLKEILFSKTIKGFELEEILTTPEKAQIVLQTARFIALRAGGHFLRYLISPALGLSASKMERKAPVLWRTFAYQGERKFLKERILPRRWHLTLGDIAV